MRSAQSHRLERTLEKMRERESERGNPGTGCQRARSNVQDPTCRRAEAQNGSKLPCSVWSVNMNAAWSQCSVGDLQTDLVDETIRPRTHAHVHPCMD
mmetsp:Transcript_4526/g.11871  ORF Transcript_4526/g.11871 Transcript_4526/m.11871 type:complete len:97 (-) Transcript_4526:783-1073(-)